MRIYIIGEKRTEEQYEKLERTLKEEGHEVVNILKVLKQIPNWTYKEREKIGHALIEMSDAVFAEQGWKKSEVAKEEVLYALSQNVNITFEVKDELPFM